MMLDLIAFDADDTLWHNESLYLDVQDRFAQLAAPYAGVEQAKQALHEVEMRNLKHYGYGIKGFTISLIEAAIEVSGGSVPAESIQSLIDLTRDMLVAKVRLIDGVEETLARLSGAHPLMLLTKGDLFEQENKIARSGMGGYFKIIEIVSDKTPGSYQTLLARHDIQPSRFLMVGNSLRSDILPVLDLGGLAVYIPYALTWSHENAEIPDAEHDRYFELEHLGLLPPLIDELERRS